MLSQARTECDAIFSISDGLPPGAKAEGATLKITAVSPTDAIEVEARLD